MKSIKLNILITLLTSIFILLSCGPSNEEIARQRFQIAQEYYQNKEFNNAKLVLDSIIEEQEGEIEFVTRAKDLIRTINIEEQKNNIEVLDSLLKEKEKELEPLMKNFIIEDEYHKKVLVHRRQKTVNSYNRTYLKSHLDLEGNFYISSHYCGPNYINHTHIKVYNKGKSVTSEVVPFDNFENRHFDDGGNYWEIVNYKDGKDNGIIDFIAENVDSPLKVMYIGKKNYYILMEKFDKEAIRDGYEISFILNDVTKLKEELKNSKKRLSTL